MADTYEPNSAPPPDLDESQPADSYDTRTSDVSAEYADRLSELYTEKPKRWWRRSWFHWLLACMIMAALGGLGAYPVTRYWILNHAHVRSAATVTVVDEITQQPLQKVTVQVGGMTTRTGDDGKAVLRNIPLGPTTLDVSQPGFSTVHRRVVIGWGSNPFDAIQLKAIGVPYHVVVTDWLSGRPIAGAHIESDTAAAQSDTNGNALLILPNEIATDTVAVTVSVDSYRAERTTLRAAASTAVPLVTGRKAVFVSKQSGTYDVYTSDADGQNKQVLLPGTGNEGVNISLAVSPDGTQAAMVSTRDKQFDADGYPLSTLVLIDVSNGSTVVLAHADQIQLIDWIGTRLVFEQAVASGADRYSIVSYDYANASRYQLAAADKFNGIISAQDMIYYVPAANDHAGAIQPYLFRVDAKGENKQTLLEKEVWSIYRTGYDTLTLQTNDTWYTHTISTKRNIISSAPAVPASTKFISQPNQGAHSLWVNTQNGQDILQLHDKLTNKDKALQAVIGLTYPVRWLTSDSAIFRVVTGTETADYAIGTTGNRPPHKIADVVNTFGLSTGQ